MNRIRLIHWNADEAVERIEQLRAAGRQVDFTVLKGGGDLRGLATDPPDAVITDLHRLSSAGRDLGLFLRKQGSTRRLPLVFAGGDPAKVARIRELLPDATYSSWSRIKESLDRAIRNPPADPKASGVATDLTQPHVRKTGLSAGLVDYKICAIDKTWSGLLFTRRKS